MSKLNKQDLRDIEFFKTKAKFLKSLGKKEESNICYNTIQEISYKDEKIKEHDKIREDFFEITNHHYYDSKSSTSLQFDNKLESLEDNTEKLLEFYDKLIDQGYETHLKLHNLDRKFSDEGHYEVLRDVCCQEIDVIKSLSPKIRFDKARKLEEIEYYDCAIGCYDEIVDLFHGNETALWHKNRLEDKRLNQLVNDSKKTNFGVPGLSVLGGGITGALIGGLVGYGLTGGMETTLGDSAAFYDFPFGESVNELFVYGGALIGGFYALSKSLK